MATKDTPPATTAHLLVDADYYLDEERPAAAVAADLRNLLAANPAAPYFLAVHVREYSDVKIPTIFLQPVFADISVFHLLATGMNLWIFAGRAGRDDPG